VETERLVLRLFRESDLDAVHTFQSDPEIVRYLYWDVRTRDESRAWLQERIAADRLEKDGDAVAFAVERREDGTSSVRSTCGGGASSTARSFFKGEWGDELIFAILRHEWEGRAAAD
jgi:RimJ/RimL family protein N-acetyltransferase